MASTSSLLGSFKWPGPYSIFAVGKRFLRSHISITCCKSDQAPLSPSMSRLTKVWTIMNGNSREQRKLTQRLRIFFSWPHHFFSIVTCYECTHPQGYPLPKFFHRAWNHQHGTLWRGLIIEKVTRRCWWHCREASWVGPFWWHCPLILMFFLIFFCCRCLPCRVLLVFLNFDSILKLIQ